MPVRDRDRQYAGAFEASVQRNGARLVMPKSFDGLLTWFAEAMSLEVVDHMHPARPSVWAEHLRRYRVTEKGDLYCNGCHKRIVDRGPIDDTCARPHTHADGQGGSVLGSPDELGAWRQLMYSASTAVDEDGYYLAPLHRAMAQLEREGRPVAVLTLRALAAGGYDWRGIAERTHQTEEQFRDYLTFALMKLWHAAVPRDERRVLVD